VQQLPDTPSKNQTERKNKSNASAVNANFAKQKKLTKRELLELADFLYSRYQHKKSLNKNPKQSIIKDTNDDKTNK
jgi:peptide methionine sulfoxide reductase MsrA